MKNLVFAVVAAALAYGTSSTIACASDFNVLHNFGGGSDGESPNSAMVVIDGQLYGTTDLGGASGYGTIFGFGLSTGKEKVLYSFVGGEQNGDDPIGLIDLDGVLYGTTVYGGETFGRKGLKGFGTIYSFNISTGIETILSEFHGRSNSRNPWGALVRVGSKLYGASIFYDGSIFSLDPNTGRERAVYSFNKSEGDGTGPFGPLVAAKGVLYGTTQSGGNLADCDEEGCGTLFSFDPSTGKETVLYRFTGGADGNGPFSNQIYIDGKLYGVTRGGGNLTACKGGCGTVFSFDLSTGTEAVVHSFDISDGAGPQAGLLKSGGKLFGTTLSGGADDCGVLFSIDLSRGSEKVLHSFAAATDGCFPMAGLVKYQGAFYGSTERGGAHDWGTIFDITP